MQTAIGIIFSSVLIAVSFIDIDLRIIPNVIVIPFTIVGLGLNIYLNPIKWWMPLAFSAGAFTFMLIISTTEIIYAKTIATFN